MPERADIAVVGGGILGLAHAYVCARRGKRVVLFERGRRATGASVRNFGMIWPIGQPAGEMHQLALRSREIWIQILAAAKLNYRPTGSLHVAHHADEADVLRRVKNDPHVTRTPNPKLFWSVTKGTSSVILLPRWGESR